MFPRTFSQAVCAAVPALVIWATATLASAVDVEFSPGVSSSKVTAASITQATGIAASRNNERVLWISNRTGAKAKIFAVDVDGKLLGNYEIPGPSVEEPSVKLEDGGDIAIGPGPAPGAQFVYLGDIGDKKQKRESVKVYRVPEPVVYARQTKKPALRKLKGVQTITLNYPDGAKDAETLFVDPMLGDLYIVTRDKSSARLYKANRQDLDGGFSVDLTMVKALDWDNVTGGTVGPSGLELILRQSNAARLWPRAAGQSVEEALSGAPVTISVIGPPAEVNGGAITFDGLGSGYYTVGEGTKPALYLFARKGTPPKQPLMLVAAGSKWKYLDDGSDQKTEWRNVGFDDAKWKEGEAQFGYGDMDEQTTISFGKDPANKQLTAYYRRTFEVGDPAAVESLVVQLIYDDGAAVYLNGKEVLRVNLGADAAFDTPASRAPSTLEDSWFKFPINRKLLVKGTNTLAVEMHQRAIDSSDTSFDLQLIATGGAGVLSSGASAN